MKIVWSIGILGFIQLFWADTAMAWGPGVHTVTALSVLNDLGPILPSIAKVITSFPVEFLYGCLSADFFVGKSSVAKSGSLHNWEGGFKFLKEAGNDQEASYAYGFLTHLVADVIAHNYFIPNLISSHPAKRGVGHLYWEMKSDYLVGPGYVKIARDVLHMDHHGCDALLNMTMGKKRSGLKTKKRIFTQTVKFSDYMYGTRNSFLSERTFPQKAFITYLACMVQFSCRLVRDFLKKPESSPCLIHDPNGRKNLRLARRRVLLPRWIKPHQEAQWFNIAEELLKR